MNNFTKNTLHQWPVIVFVIAILFSAGIVYATHLELCRQIRDKVSIEIYDRDRQHDRIELQLRLQRIEEKLDAINQKLETYPHPGRN